MTDRPVLLGAYGVNRSYPGGRQALKDVSFELRKGEILGLFGPNGSGKSTLLKSVAGLLPLEAARGEGLVRLNGAVVHELSASARAKGIAYVGPELGADFPLTAEEAVGLGRICHQSGWATRSFSGHDARARDLDQVRAAMNRCLCWQLRARDLPTLSGGERQLVALARAVAQEARVLLLDEALSKMDLDHQAKIGRVLGELAQEGRGVIIVSHDLNLAAEWSTHALLLKRGERMAWGPLSEVLNESNLRALYSGADLSVRPSPMTGAPKVFFGG